LMSRFFSGANRFARCSLGWLAAGGGEDVYTRPANKIRPRSSRSSVGVMAAFLFSKCAKEAKRLVQVVG